MSPSASRPNAIQELEFFEWNSSIPHHYSLEYHLEKRPLVAGTKCSLTMRCCKPIVTVNNGAGDHQQHPRNGEEYPSLQP